MLDLLDSDHKVTVAKCVLESRASTSDPPATDSVSHNALLYLAGVLADSVTALTITGIRVLRI
jgi:hypothetical protein